MAEKKDYWTSKRSDGKWAVKHTGAQRASYLFETQEQAWKEARRLARTSGTEAFLKDREGKIRARNSYGNDPFPPKG
ncbi:MAG: DUF2188 domain-containing protein [Bacteroidales bacterium]|nr:DUF2188 domain-containing protein [Bacteroidales bacterium]